MTNFDPRIHHRRSIRLPGYDYSEGGAYFVTTNTHGWLPLFGEIRNSEMILSRFGKILHYTLLDLPRRYPHIILDTFCIMPDHLHALIILDYNETDKRYPLSEIVRALKSHSSRRINELRKMPGINVWQRNYYEHIVRGDADFARIQNYILNNPLNWKK